ncbi:MULTISPECIES: OB-fold-containig protein [unclassified Yoonia]|uniref:OB-fold-containig protein n=1 Tax=unclassified Yoonia TaxID=2629118 RepID=UPI002AFF4E2F|nr:MULTISPECIES: OB-fold-containig protein [unclassified Yoonia]
MLDFLLSPAVVPFSIALGLLAGLLVLEITALVMGGSIFGDAGEDAAGGGGFDKGPAVDLIDLPASVDLSQIDTGGIDLADLDLGNFGSDPATPAPTGGVAAALGIGKVPFLIWLAALLAGFGLSGYVLQSVTSSIIGAPLPALVAVLPAGVIGVWFARAYGGLLARLIPKTETSVRSDAMLNRRQGIVSQGTARRNTPAEVRVLDGYGNFHFIRAEPLDCNDEIPAGTEVLVLRVRLGPERGKFRIVALSQL